MDKFKKVWFITGASRGFGFEIAKAALAIGDKVVATVRHDRKDVAARLNNPSGLLVVKLDVTHETEVRLGVQRAIDRFGRIDVVVNNAGFGMVTAIEEASATEVRKQYDTNVFGLLNVTRAVLPLLRGQRSGHIINVSSLFGYDAIPGWALYGSTKFAVEGLSKGLAVELAPFGIHVTAIAPGLFSTDFLSPESYVASADPIDDYKRTAVWNMRQRASELNGKQPGDPEKLASAVVKLAHLDNPPVHLPIGKDAVAMYRKNAERTLAGIARWEELSAGTDHEQANKQEKPIQHVQQ